MLRRCRSPDQSFGWWCINVFRPEQSSASSASSAVFWISVGELTAEDAEDCSGQNTLISHYHRLVICVKQPRLEVV
jgi:hypothetical protein